MSFPRNSAVPDLAIVPIFSIISSSDIPIPLSDMVKVLFSSSTMTLIFKSSERLANLELLIDLNLSLSRASDALDINSLRKISLFE